MFLIPRRNILGNAGSSCRIKMQDLDTDTAAAETHDKSQRIFRQDPGP